MAPIIELCDVSFTYRQRSRPSIANVSLVVEAGDFMLITGSTGCGKSTLLQLLNGLIPHEHNGLLTGAVMVDGNHTCLVEIAVLSKTAGMVFQSPDDQIFATTVFDEVAFVLENSGMELALVTQRVAESLALVGLQGKQAASVNTLSGGQKQRLALAAVLAARPAVLLLDEPISQLDPEAAQSVMAVLKTVNEQYGTTIMIVEHRLHEVLPFCRQAVIMDGGAIVWQGTRRQLLLQSEILTAYNLRVPQAVAICRCLGLNNHDGHPQTAIALIRQHYAGRLSAGQAAATLTGGLPGRQTALAVQTLSFGYAGRRQPVLSNLNISILQGQLVALMGGNGAGKSTLLHLICGLLRPDSGCIKVMGHAVRPGSRQVGLVLQNPDLMLFSSTVTEEVSIGAGADAECLDELLKRLRLSGMQDEFPLALSRGQRLRVAIAAVLARQPDIILLDEPTTGQDIGHIDDIVAVLQQYVARGGTVLFCTHDGEVAARIADRLIVLHQGQVAADGHPRSVFADRTLIAQCRLKTPDAAVVARELYDRAALTVEEVVGYVQQANMAAGNG